MTLNANEPTQNPPETNSKEIKITDLPDEVLEVIFLKMPQKDLHQNLVLVCHRFKNIIYHPKFTPTVKIEVWPSVFKSTNVRIAKKVLEIYPNSKFEFFYKIRRIQTHNNMGGWIPTLRPIASSIAKMTIQCDSEDFVLFSIIAQFENLEVLDLNIDYKSNENFWQYDDDIGIAGPEFENQFPSLKYLKIRTNRNSQVS